MQSHNISICYQETYDSKELEEKYRILLSRAWEAFRNAYAPYSQFKVGAALQLQNGTIVIGNNQENSAYPSGLCAERVAIFAASAQYPNIPIEAIAIVANTSLIQSENPITPCGACRQVLTEYEHLAKKPITVILQGDSEKIWIIEGVKNLLPFMFHGEQLKK